MEWIFGIIEPLLVREKTTHIGDGLGLRLDDEIMDRLRESFRQQVREALKTAATDAIGAGYSPQDTKLATFAVVGFLDESILNAQNPLFADWPRKPLQEELFGTHMAGEVFFQNLRSLLSREDSGDLADLLEVYYLCVLLGYRGRYSTGGGELHSILSATADKIRRICLVSQKAIGGLGPGPAAAGLR